MVESVRALFEPAGAVSILGGLADITFKAVLVLAIAGIATSLTRKRAASIRHAIWLAAVAGIISLPVLSAALPNWGVIPATTAIPVEVVSPEVPEYEAAPAEEFVATNKAEERQPLPARGPEVEAAPSGDVAVANRDSRNVFVTAIAGLWDSLRSLHWSVILLGVWLLGALAIVGNHLVGAFGLFLVARRARPIEAPEWQDLADEIGDRLWITRRVELLKSHATTMPVTWGGRRPVVLLPSDADTWSEERRRYVLTHEFAHIRRWDCTTQAVAQMACALYWFNPLVWIAARRLRIERERACDDQVLMAGGKPSSYAEHLLDIARSLRATLASPLGAVAMARPSQLEGRVLAILDPNRKRKSFSRSHTGVVMTLSLAFILPIAAMAPESAPVADQPPVGQELAVSEAPTPEAQPQPQPEPRALPSDATDIEDVQSKHSDDVARDMIPEIAYSRPNISLPDTIDTRKRKLADAFMLALEDEDEEIRRQAAHMLGELEDPRSIAALRRAVREDESEDVRRAALWALSEMDDEAVMPVLMDLVDSDLDRESLRQIAYMIGDNADDGDREAGRALMRLLDNEDAEVRSTAVWGLAEMEYVEAIDAIVGMTEDPDDEVSERAVWALSELADEADGDRAVPALSRALASSNPDVRSMAAYALGEIESRASVDALVDALGDDNAEVRERAAWALGEIEDESAVAGLTRALRDDVDDVRQMAAYALMEIDSPASLRALASAIDDPSVNVRRHAMYALAELEDPESIDILARAATEGDVQIRKSAVAALAELEDNRAGGALVAALSDSNAEIRRYAAHGLSELDPTPEIISGLQATLGDSNAEVRRAAIWALGEMKSRSSLAALLVSLDDGNAENRRAAAYAIGEILEDVKDPMAVTALSKMLSGDSAAENRKAAAYALGEIGSPAAIDALRAALEDGNREVRRAAAHALGSIDWEDDDWDEEDDWEDGEDDDWDESDDWDEDCDCDDGTSISISLDTAGLGALVEGATEVALASTAAALSSVDLDYVFDSISHSLAEVDIDAMMDQVSVELAHVEHRVRLDIDNALISAFVNVIEDDPWSDDARAARKALKRMENPRAKRELKRFDD